MGGEERRALIASPLGSELWRTSYKDEWVGSDIAIFRFKAQLSTGKMSPYWDSADGDGSETNGPANMGMTTQGSFIISSILHVQPNTIDQCPPLRNGVLSGQAMTVRAEFTGQTRHEPLWGLDPEIRKS